MGKALEHLAFFSGSCCSSDGALLPALDKEIRDLGRQCKMPSAFIELDYQTEPSFFSALSTYGHEHNLVLIKPEGFSTLMGMGIRSVRNAFLGGQITETGYLHHLRFHPEIRGGSFLARGYKEFHHVFNKRPLPVTLTSILEENFAARQLLESNRAGSCMPVYQPVSRFLTAMIPLIGPGARWPMRYRERRPESSLQTRCLEPEDLPMLLKLFNDWGKVTDGAPCLQSADLSGSPGSLFKGLDIRDMVGLFHAGELVGAMGIWNQQPYRQIVLSHLCNSLAGFRNFWHAGQSVFGRCPFPESGGRVNFVLLDPWAFKPGKAKEFMPILLKACVKEAQRRGACFAAIGIAEKNPLINAVKSIFFMPYWSIIYQVFWPETGSYQFGKKSMQIANLGAL